MDGLANDIVPNALDMSLLTVGEAQKLLNQWNQTAADYPRSQCIHQWFESQVELTPDRVAVVFDNRQLTYSELNRRANRLAHYLQALNVGPEVVVGICLERSLHLVIGLLGILKAGGAYVPLDPAFPQDRLAFMVEDSQMPVILTQQSLLSTLPEHQARVVCLDADEELIAKGSEENPKTEVTPENLAYILYTSGSTGKPKGVQILHYSLVNFINSMKKEPGLTGEDVLLAVTTISFDIAGLELYLPLVAGACVVLVKREVASDAARLSELLASSGATVMQATPATWRLLLAAGWQGNKQLKILCGGEALTPALADRLVELVGSVWNMYGPTETTVWSAVYRVEESNGKIPIGRAIDNTEVYLVDPMLRRQSDPLRPVPIGTAGELLIGGDGIARGYLNRPELTAQKFIPDPFSDRPGARLYRTGDLARYLPDGNIEFIGRIDHQVKIRGYRIELGDIEAALSKHPAVREGVVVAREDALDDPRLVAYVVPKSQAASEQQIKSQVRDFLKEKLPDYMVPAAFVVMDSLPLTPNGKIDRRALPAPNQERVESEVFVAPRTSTEKQLAEIWSEILGIELVGRDDNFFNLGGHSLLAARLLYQLRSTFGVELSLLELFADPTVAGLAKAIESANSGVASSVEVPDLEADLVLDPAIYPEPAAQKPASELQQVFLTGATGFIGAFLLHELLQQHPETTIYCLVRAANAEVGKQKIRQNLERYQVWKPQFNSRIIPVIGDLAQPKLGLSDRQFSDLAKKIDVIYHNGAFVNLIYPYAALRAANVLGTQEVLRLASQTKIKPVHFISTLDVFQSPAYAEMQEILESDDLASGEGLSDGYAQSKWVAEKLVMTARERGLPICIYRLGTIVGHSQTGVSQTTDLIARMLKGFIQLGSAPDLDMTLNLTPVDYASRAIVHLSQQQASVGKVFHILNPQLLPMRELVSYINDLGYPVETIANDRWQAKLANISLENALSSLVSLFANQTSTDRKTYLETSALASQAFSCQNTLDGLAGSAIVCPSVNFQLLNTYFSYFIHHGFLPAPAQLTTSDAASEPVLVPLTLH
ncbi:MAG: amino acid adenylation domain-containing protein [Cyanosarcina radialis HA8281-LM2]|jgi:amino acid adenylation domain-containing protein/thioester reductase-like protein|nr:amino acid adenylation domain-containing protein [Cyanosarcina radialis HA8281-LM2]